jgi:holo-ACP synthase CitX
MQRQLLEARDRRQALIDRAGEPDGTLRLAQGRTVVFASTSIPGPEKYPEGLSRLFTAACEHLASRLGASPASHGLDALGPWALFRTTLPAAVVKRITVELESARPSGRLLDLDVYDGGRPADRASLGLPPRACLVCDRPAVECIRLERHGAEELSAAVEQLLTGDTGAGVAGVRLRGASGGSDPRGASARHASSRATERLAACLVTGARVELALTPKPGLVDHHDNGSHPDLSFELMTRSIDLLPQYFDELIVAFAARDPLPAGGLGVRDPLPAALAACVEVGRRAERRMLAEIGANAHRGYIFLAGLVLLGSLDGEDRVRDGIRNVARAVGDLQAAEGSREDSHGAVVRERHALGGILGEALDGLPSVFEHGLPALRGRRASDGARRGADSDQALHYTMAVLMQAVEDTTTVFRSGPEGLSRIRHDGRQLQHLIELGQAHLPWLRELNATYRGLNLTMGGVADCLALTVALDRWLP